MRTGSPDWGKKKITGWGVYVGRHLADKLQLLT